MQPSIGSWIDSGTAHSLVAALLNTPPEGKTIVLDNGKTGSEHRTKRIRVTIDNTRKLNRVHGRGWW